MWKVICVSILALCLGAVARADDNDGNKGDLTIDGVGIVPAPAEGYTWQKINEAPGDTPKVMVFVASKDGSTSKVVLSVEQTTADTDKKKLARIAGDYNGLLSGLQDQGYTNLKGTSPPRDPPFDQRVSFMVFGNDKNGTLRVLLSTIFFGNNVYHFQVAASSEDEAKASRQRGSECERKWRPANHTERRWSIGRRATTGDFQRKNFAECFPCRTSSPVKPTSLAITSIPTRSSPPSICRTTRRTPRNGNISACTR